MSYNRQKSNGNDINELSLSGSNKGVIASELHELSGSWDTSLKLKITPENVALLVEIANKYDIEPEMAAYLPELREFEIVVVIDDSGSMSTKIDNSERTRWNELCGIVKTVIEVVMKFNSRGIDLHFLNKGVFNRVKDSKVVDELFQTYPCGYTPLVPVLDKIFTSKLAARGRDKKLLVFVATDGEPTSEDGDPNVHELERLMRDIRNVETTHVSFLLCTDGPDCVGYLKGWDQQMRNVVVTDDYETAKKEMRLYRKNENYPFSKGDYIVKALVGGFIPEMGDIKKWLYEVHQKTTTEQSRSQIIRQTEHVRLVKHQQTIQYIIVESASVCCDEFVDLKLAYNNGSFANEDASAQTKPFKNNINFQVVSLDVALPSIAVTIFKTEQIVSFKNAYACISQLLSIRDKLIYLVISAKLGEFVVPLIHDHICIEHIYIYRNCDNEESADWTEEYQKVRDNRFSIDHLIQQIKEDIDLIMKRPSRWSRSKALLMELCLQAPQTDIPLPINKATDDDLNTWRVVILYLGLHRHFHLTHSKIRINEFNNTEECMRSIETEGIPVFLIISMNTLNDLPPLAELDAIHAVYIVSNLKYTEQIQTLSRYSKLGGVFGPNEDLLEQLITDICFYRQIQIHTPTMSIFKIEPNILSRLTDAQTDFLCFQLFSSILSELPTQLITVGNNDTINSGQLLFRLIETNTQITNLFKQFDISTLHKSVTELNNINQQIVSMAKNVNSSSATIYRAQLVSRKDIEMIKENSNALLAIQAFVLASFSFQSTVEICRRAVNNQLMVVLFELKLSDKTFVTHVHSNVVVLNLGTLFRIISIDLAPDNVWRVQLEVDDTAMQRIQDQLRIEIGGYLTWLTFGNYLATFRRFNAARYYYDYLLQLVPSEHPSLASIYNNMGLMYSENKDDKKALELYKKALETKVLQSCVTVKHKNLLTSDLPPLRSTSIDRISILTKIAEITCCQGDRETSLDYYRRALEIATDAISRQFYQARIEALLPSDDNI